MRNSYLLKKNKSLEKKFYKLLKAKSDSDLFLDKKNIFLYDKRLNRKGLMLKNSFIK